MNIGIIGAGNIGGTLAKLWAQKGHQITISCRHPEELDSLVQQIGPNSCNGTIEEAARFGEVVVLSIPLGGIKSTGARIANFIPGKIVIDTMNPFVERDGDIAKEIIQSGLASGEATQIRFPSAKIVRAFSNVRYIDLQSQAHRTPPLIAIPFATNDVDSREIVSALISDAGFDPFSLGELKNSKPQDPDGALFGKALTITEIRKILKQ